MVSGATFFYFKNMGFASQAETSLRNNRNLLKGKTSLRSKLSHWYGKTSRKPPWEELKAWKKSEVSRKKRLAFATIMMIVVFTLLSVVIITNILQ